MRLTRVSAGVTGPQTETGGIVSRPAVKVAAFTGGWSVPSARFRVRQYIPALSSLGIEVKEFVSRLGSYPPVYRWARYGWAAATVCERAWSILRGGAYDLTVLQREMVSTFVTLEPLTRSPRLLDVDDAIWLRRRGGFARRLAEMCEAVICGNSFLAEKFGAWNRNVTVVPTAVDTDRFCPSQNENRGSRDQVICWSGTSGGYEYLGKVERALCIVLNECPGTRLRIVSDNPPRFRQIAPHFVEYVPWSPGVEVSAVQDAAAAIMPLDDSLWSRGKCAYKLLTYMACGVPVVASPVGMNAEVLRHADVGFAARTEEEWVDALKFLLTHPDRAAKMGAAGKQLIERKYSVRVLAPILARTLLQYAR